MKIELTKTERIWLVKLVEHTMPKIKYVNYMPTKNSLKEYQSRIKIIDKLNKP